MKITSLDVDHFGLWNDLHLPKMEAGLNVFYGPNEAGKTTLMDFVRSIFYGMREDRLRYVLPFGQAPQRRQRDKDGNIIKDKPRRTKRLSGGAISVWCPDGDFKIKRVFDPNDIRIGSDDTLSITSSDSTDRDIAAIRMILAGIDEPLFNNVFTFGLDELRKLGTLGDKEVSEMLFNLSVGLDRISLVEVLRSLTSSRNELLDPAGSNNGLLNKMVAQRKKLHEELGQARTAVWEYTRVLTEQRKLDRLIDQISEELVALRHEARINEIARNIIPIWDNRSEIQGKITAMGTVINVPEDVITELDEIHDSLTKKHNQLRDLKGQYLDHRKKIDSVNVNETLWRLAPRIEIILEEESRIIELDQEITEFENEANTLEAELREHEQQLRYGRRKTGTIAQEIAYHAVPGTTTAAPQKYAAPQIASFNGETKLSAKTEELGSSSAVNAAHRAAQQLREMQKAPVPEPARNLIEYRVYAKQVKRTKQRLARSRHHFEELTERGKVLSETMKTEMFKRDNADLQDAIDRAGDMVTNLRRRQAIGQRLDEMTQYRKELDRKNVYLIQNQAVPPWVLAGLGFAAVITVILIIFAVLNPEQIHPAFGGVGAIVVVAGWVAKIIIERQNAQKLEYNQRQLSLLMTQMDQAKNDAAAIDAKFPASGLTIENRFQNAQKELADLEKLIPVEAQRKETSHQLKVEEDRLNRAKEAAATAAQRWSEWLNASALPSDWTPTQIRDLIGKFDNVGEIRKNLDRIYEDINGRVRDLRIITDRIDRVAAETGLVFADGLSYVEVLGQMRKQLTATEEGTKRRKVLAEELKKFKPMRRKIVSALNGLKTRRAELLGKYGAKTSDDLLLLAQRYHDYLALLDKEAVAQREVVAAIGGYCTEDIIAAQLTPENRIALDTRKDQIERRTETSETHLREETEKHGRLSLELQQLAEDQTPQRKHRELAILNDKISKSVHDWQVKAVSCRILEDIRKAYERERQPQALAETSDYFRRLTSGRYQRVWTPLGEDTLKIDDADSNTLDVGWLSRGTREQLFIALRLALSAQYSRRGADLPLILDDVMVNFDTGRAKTAAKLLEELANTGKQIILFTCHEHIGRIFQKMDVPVKILPQFEDDKRTIRVLLPYSLVRKKEEERAAREADARLAVQMEVLRTQKEIEATRVPDEPPADATDIWDEIPHDGTDIWNEIPVHETPAVSAGTDYIVVSDSHKPPVIMPDGLDAPFVQNSLLKPAENEYITDEYFSSNENDLDYADIFDETEPVYLRHKNRDKTL